MKRAIQRLKEKRNEIKKPLAEKYLLARTGVYVLESIPLILITGLARFIEGQKFRPEVDLAAFRDLMFERIKTLHEMESNDIKRGVYPLSILEPEKPATHMLRFIKLYKDAVGAHYRRIRKKNKEFSKQAKEWLGDLPEYYQRNFHFQTDGYLNERSAELYDHQVEILFRGTADVMRRRILPPLKTFLGKKGGGGFKVLEVAAGAGSTTRFVAETFKSASITAFDISHPYLRVARKRLKSYSRINFVQGDAAKTPFGNDQFDVVYSVFLFHELPSNVRREVLVEKLRLVKPGGLIVIIDSLQLGDDPPMDLALEQFPRDFHEPFYLSYMKSKLENLIEEVMPGARLQSDVFFLSKRIIIQVP